MKIYKIIQGKYDILYCVQYNPLKLENARLKLSEMRRNGEVLNYGPKSRRSILKVRQKIYDIIELNINPQASLLTLTYKKEIKDYKLSLILFNKFIKRAEYQTKKPLSYLATKELQNKTRGGVIHYHLIIFSHPELTNKDWANLWSYGFIKYIKIMDFNITRIANYLSGNILIDKNQSIKKGQRVYHTSRDLKRPKITEIDERIVKLIDKIELNKGENWSSYLINNKKKP